MLSPRSSPSDKDSLSILTDTTRSTLSSKAATNAPNDHQRTSPLNGDSKALTGQRRASLSQPMTINAAAAAQPRRLSVVEQPTVKAMSQRTSVHSLLPSILVTSSSISSLASRNNTSRRMSQLVDDSVAVPQKTETSSGQSSVNLLASAAATADCDDDVYLDYLSSLIEIGPPRLLRYQTKQLRASSSGGTDGAVKASLLSSSRSTMDEDAASACGGAETTFFHRQLREHLLGGIECEFCHRITLPWPISSDRGSMDDNENKAHCCVDYRDYIQSIIDFSIYMDAMSRELHHHGLTADVPKELRSVERQLGVPQNDAAAPPAAVAAHNKPLPFDYVSKLRQNKGLLARKIEEIKKIEKLIKNESLPDFNLQSDLNARERARQKLRADAINRAKQQEEEMRRKHRNAGRAPKSESQLDQTELFKTAEERIRNRINYILSNRKFIVKGWTIINSTVNEINRLKEEAQLLSGGSTTVDTHVNAQDEQIVCLSTAPFELFPVDLARNIIKKYKSGATFQVILTDSTGNVYYPDGKLAVLISKCDAYATFMSFHDDKLSTLLASFDSRGNAFCNYTNGNLRYVLNCVGGISFDIDGKVLRRWLWPVDSKSFVFHPIQFTLNEYMSIQIHSRFRIIFYYRSKYGSCKFNVGCRVSVNSQMREKCPHLRVKPCEPTCMKSRARTSQLLLAIERALNPSKKTDEDDECHQQLLLLKLPVLVSVTNDEASFESSLSSGVSMTNSELRIHRQNQQQPLLRDSVSLTASERERLVRVGAASTVAAGTTGSGSKRNSINFSLQNFHE